MRNSLIILLLFLWSLPLLAQERTISGTVTDTENNQPLPGVTILIKGTTIGATTNIDGKFTIKVGSGVTLVFSYVGYITQEVVLGSSDQINIGLVPDIQKLDEVVVVGYGVQKKSLVTGSIAKIGNEEIIKGSNLRVNQALQGKAAGVTVMNNSGQPGDFVSVRVRGTGTNGNAEPLYIVDGLPMGGYSIDFINPSDIESIEVLKDAASSAIYGARGANGVILITTKQGKKSEKIQITYDGYYGVQNPWRKLDVLNSQEYMMLINEASANAGLSPKFSQAMMDTLTTNTDWQDEMFFYNAPKQSHVLSLTGGSEKSTYSSSFSYYGQDGIVAKGKSNFERMTYRLNTTREFGLLTVGSNLNYAHFKNRGIATNDHFAATSLIQALNMPPIVPVTFPDGSYAAPEDFGIGVQEITNPVAMLSYTNSQTVTNKLVGGVYGEFDFVKISDAFKGLKFKTNYSSELTYVNNRAYTPEYDLDATHKSPVSRISKRVEKYVKWNIENVITYDKTIDEHHFNVILGHSAMKDWDENIDGSKTDAIFDDLDHAYLNNATNPNASLSGVYNEHTILSYFGRVNYDLKDKYMLTAILRRDGSSRFGPDNKFGNFPSLSLGWVMSNESFMNFLTPLVNFAKLRASWGRNGNEEIGNFRYTSVLSSNYIYYFGTDQTQYNGVVPDYYSNPVLKWETSEQLNVGMDLRMLQNKVRVTTDFYVKNTKDWLLMPPSRLIAGNTPSVQNMGLVRNSGVEMEIQYKDNFGDLRFSTLVTGNYNVNKMIELPNESHEIKGGNGGFGQSGIAIAREGWPVGAFFGYKTDGLFQTEADVNNYKAENGSLIQPLAKPGDIKFVDTDGNGVLNDDDKVNLGNPYPDFTGGIDITLEWKNLDFNMFWYAALGHQIWDATRRYDMNYTNYRGVALGRWIGEGTSNSFPRVTLADLNNNFKTPSDFHVKDADYLRLRTITLGYTIPKSVTNFLKIAKVRFFVSAENLLTFTKYDGYEPEIGGSPFNLGVDHGIYPQARTIMGGLNVSF